MVLCHGRPKRRGWTIFWDPFFLSEVFWTPIFWVPRDPPPPGVPPTSFGWVLAGPPPGIKKKPEGAPLPGGVQPDGYLEPSQLPFPKPQNPPPYLTRKGHLKGGDVERRASSRPRTSNPFDFRPPGAPPPPPPSPIGGGGEGGLPQERPSALCPIIPTRCGPPREVLCCSGTSALIVHLAFRSPPGAFTPGPQVYFSVVSYPPSPTIVRPTNTAGRARDAGQPPPNRIPHNRADVDGGWVGLI